MKNLKQLIKRILYTIVILIIVTMSFQIWSIPNYTDGKASVVYSEDGKYKGMTIYPNNIKEWWTLAILVRVKDNEVIAIEPLTRDSEVIRVEGWFDCLREEYYNKYKGNCFSPADAMDIIKLPPSLWHRVHAWLTIKIRGLENPNLKETDRTPQY